MGLGLARRPPRRRGGWSMVELLVVAGIFGAIFMLIPTLLSNAVTFFSVNTTRAQLQSEARNTMDEMQRLVRKASSGSIAIGANAGQPPYSRLTMTADGAAVVIFQEGRSLKITENGQIRVMSKNVQSLAFSKNTFPTWAANGLAALSTPAVNISLTVSKNVNQRRKTVHLITEDATPLS